ncbi:MAG: pilus assembly protein TadG-related protein [Kiritimatiellae bacterium]|nr:pilus assembly protein TadG-related protein [Kiritimatiellia bacterium]
MIFLLMVILFLSIVLIWKFDLHNAVHLKMRAQNAADAAALAAARWQGITLNLIGDLNIMQAAALSAADNDLAARIAEIQARLCFAGPIIGLLASQQAAKNNGIYVNPAFSERLAGHAGQTFAYPVDEEPYPDCWREYGEMLMSIASAGVAAGPDNTCLYNLNYSGDHPLLNMNFYDAIAGQLWCWFWIDPARYSFLRDYKDFTDWEPLPPPEEIRPENSEVFGLGLQTFPSLPGGEPMVAIMNTLRAQRSPGPQVISNEIVSAEARWFVYQPEKWSDWTIMKDSSFPVFPEKQVKPQYDYTGADAVARVEAVAERHMPGKADRTISCTAAAKPFGCLISAAGEKIRPDAYGLVLPAFHDVRLIPVDASSSPSGGAYDLQWREHIEIHLAPENGYPAHGIEVLDADCWYCQQLIAWENAAFRQTGIDWLSDTNNSNSCEIYSPGPGPGGGTRRGH